MSLINDALKRAAQKPPTPPGASELAAGLRPAEERPHGFPVITLLIVLIPLIALGVWFLAKGLQMHDRSEPSPVSARAPEPVARAPLVVVQPTNPPASVRPPPIPPHHVYKLQGIYWRPAKPSAVVNDKTVYVGDDAVYIRRQWFNAVVNGKLVYYPDDSVETARVTAIDQESVTLIVDGRPKVLR